MCWHPKHEWPCTNVFESSIFKYHAVWIPPAQLTACIEIDSFRRYPNSSLHFNWNIKQRYLYRRYSSYWPPWGAAERCVRTKSWRQSYWSEVLTQSKEQNYAIQAAAQATIVVQCAMNWHMNIALIELTSYQTNQGLKLRFRSCQLSGAASKVVRSMHFPFTVSKSDTSSPLIWIPGQDTPWATK